MTAVISHPRKPLTIGSLFAGIGGFDLAGEFYGWSTSWFVEWDASCRHWLAEHFPGRPIYGDITQVEFTDVEAVDILCGGFPCQPNSVAGKQLGTADPRWLWPHFARAIRALRPRYVVAENVPGLMGVNGGRAFAEVLRDLAALGYDAEWSDLSAGDVGAPHERDRVWIVGYANGGRREQRDAGQRQYREPGSRYSPMGDSSSGGRGARGGIEARRSERGCEVVGHASSAGRPQLVAPAVAGHSGHPAGERCGVEHAATVGDSHGCGLSERSQLDGGAPQDPADWHSRRRHAHGPRVEVRAWRDGTPVRGADGTVRLIPREAAEAGPQSSLWPVADGLPGRVARLRAIGNTVVPQCVIEGPFRVIAEREALNASAA